MGYSCFSSLFYVAFETPTDKYHKAWDLFVEIFFYVDIILNFFSEIKDPDTNQNITDLKEIAKSYVNSWFFIDFISIFPFHLMLPTGALTKLFRLARMPRMIKLIDVNRFKNLLKGFEGAECDTEEIVQQYFILYVYNVFRLIIIAIFITYIIGCITLFMSNDLNSDIDVEEGLTFSANFELGEYSYHRYYAQLITICYFALTTLSTVGYGDMYPISNLEKISAVVIMLCGVAFFSFIMGNFIENLKNYDAKMGTPDKSEELQAWLISL